MQTHNLAGANYRQQQLRRPRRTKAIAAKQIQGFSACLASHFGPAADTMCHRLMSEDSDEPWIRRLLDVGRALTTELDQRVVLDRVLETAREIPARATPRWAS